MRWSLAPEKLPVLEKRKFAVSSLEDQEKLWWGNHLNFSLIYLKPSAFDIVLFILPRMVARGPSSTSPSFFCSMLSSSSSLTFVVDNLDCNHLHSHRHHHDHRDDYETFSSRAKVTESRSAEGAGEEGSTPREGRLSDDHHDDDCVDHHHHDCVDHHHHDFVDHHHYDLDIKI